MATPCQTEYVPQAFRLYRKNIDATADMLYKLYFTGHGDNDDEVCAVFFIDRNGKAVHVAGRLGDDFYINISRAEPGQKGAWK
jgi:hypothetical protein